MLRSRVDLSHFRTILTMVCSVSGPVNKCPGRSIILFSFLRISKPGAGPLNGISAIVVLLLPSIFRLLRFTPIRILRNVYFNLSLSWLTVDGVLKIFFGVPRNKRMAISIFTWLLMSLSIKMNCAICGITDYRILPMLPNTGVISSFGIEWVSRTGLNWLPGGTGSTNIMLTCKACEPTGTTRTRPISTTLKRFVTLKHISQSIFPRMKYIAGLLGLLKSALYVVVLCVT